MLTGIDISSYQRGLSLTTTRPGFAIMKATEGTSLVDKFCDGWVTQCQNAGIPWGFYHFARPNDATKEARHFYDNTKNYVGKGIPVLDFEDARLTSAWMESWVTTYHNLSGVWPWVYMNYDFAHNRGYGTELVKKSCGLWLAGYPQRLTAYPAGKQCPYAVKGWTLAAWQFTDRLSLGGYSLDGDIFYGDTSAWALYANPSQNQASSTQNQASSSQNDASSSQIPSGVSQSAWESQYGYARRVVSGEFGNGGDRVRRLGSRYSLVQAAVNVLVNGSDNQLAKLVIAGKMGNGRDREWILGSRYAKVQVMVNQILR